MDRTLVRRLQERNAQLARGESVPSDFLKSIQAVNFRNFPQNTLIHLKSPVSAVVGKNGTGKSTVLFLAGSAYAPPLEEGKSRTKGKTFNDFVPDTQKDIIPIGSQYGFIYADGTDHRYIRHVRKAGSESRQGQKEWDKRGDKTERKLKTTIFVGFEKTISNGLLLADYYNLSASAIAKRLDAIGKNATDLSELSSDVVKIIRRVTSRSYKKIQRRTDKYSKLSEYCYGYVVDGQYSDIACGSGEISLIRMIDVVSSAPGNSLILLDEPENGVHQTAQAVFLEFLFKEALEKSHQIIFTTHSEFFLQYLNSDSIILLEASPGENKIYPRSTNRSIAFKAISERLQPKVLAIVEDELSELFLSELLESDPSTREQVKIRASLIEGGWKNQVRTEFPKVYALFKYANDALQHLELKPVLVLDGDAKQQINFSETEKKFGTRRKIDSFIKDSELNNFIKELSRLLGKVGWIGFKTAFKHHVPKSRENTIVDLIDSYLAHFLTHTYFLPGAVSPEILLYDWLHNSLANRTSRSQTLLALLHRDKQTLFFSSYTEKAPTRPSEKRDFCKKKIASLENLKDHFLRDTISQWVAAEENKPLVDELIGKFRGLVD